VIYTEERWAPALLNYVCYECFSGLVLDTDGPVCPFHGNTMWLRKDRRNLFAGIRAKLMRVVK